MSSAEAKADLIEQFTRLWLRGWYRLFTILVVVVAMSCVLVFALKIIWVSPAQVAVDEISDRPDFAPELTDSDESAGEEEPGKWIRDIFDRTDVTHKYKSFNDKLDELVSRGGMSPSVAQDAKRGNGIYRRKEDDWTDAGEYNIAPEDTGTSSAKFNPKVTLSGV